MPNLTLSAQAANPTASTLTNAVYRDGYWYVVSLEASALRVNRSNNLVDWEVVGTNTAGYGIDTGADVFAMGGGYYMLGHPSNVLLHSQDAVSWSVAALPGNSARTRIKVLGGKIFAFNTENMSVGLTPTALTSVGQPARAVEYDGKGTFACVGADHRIYTSTDGLTWTMNAFTGVVPGYGGDPYFTNLTYGEGVWIASGNSMNLFRSTDLVNWTIPDTGGKYGLAYGAGLWVALDGFGLKSSADGGVTWTAESVPLSDESGGGVSYANGLWVVSRRGSQLAFGHAKAQPFNRLFTGVVRDSSGNFAARRVSLLREDHTVINSTVSSIIDGYWALKSPHAGETLLLITGEPAKNAIVYERITPPAAT